MRLRPQDYEFRRIAGANVEPPPRSWVESFGLWMAIPIVTLLPTWLLKRLGIAVEE